MNPKRPEEAPPQEKVGRKAKKKNAPPKRKGRRPRPEDARARHYTMVTCLVYFAQQAEPKMLRINGCSKIIIGATLRTSRPTRYVQVYNHTL